ncbi:MAG: SRPBCC family protein [Aeromicrobium sp.]
MSKTHRVHVTHDFASDPATVFAKLSEHENLGAIFPAKISRVCDGTDGTRNGVGSTRSLKPLGLPPAFNETVTKSEPNTLIEYKISKGSPLRNHIGVQRLTPNADGGTHLDYTIEFDAPVPGLAATVAASLQKVIAKGLPKLAD